MAKDRRKRINCLKLEIEDMEDFIEESRKKGKKAFADRMSRILEKKKKRLEVWISNC
tara:strand:- start:212 stop:382 length:171 start_codon:yes stop_codon:yes gene_type:complete